MPFEFDAQYNRDSFVQFLQGSFLPDDYQPESESIDVDDLNFKLIEEVTSLGTCPTLDADIFEVKHSSTNYARVTLSREAFRLMLHKSNCNRALIAFLPENSDQYRFSLLHIEAEQKKKSVRIEHKYSNPRRYSYVLGKGIGTYTPHKYLQENGRVVNFDDLKERFSVEILTKAFYQELANWYAWAMNVVQYPNDIKDPDDNRKFNSEALIRMVTRLIFVWFLKQKKLIPEEFFDEKYIPTIIKGFEPDTKNLVEYSTDSHYYKAILQNLFFAMLNCPITPEGKSTTTERQFCSSGDSDDNANQKLMRYQKFFKNKNPQEFIDLANKVVPFLNGGLFDCLDKPEKGMYCDAFTDIQKIEKQLIVPDALFFGKKAGKNQDLSAWYNDPTKKSVDVMGLIDLLKQYNFTVEENMPYDQEVSLDPELLGNVFENLLASYNSETQTTARKQTGSFYTPREIVQYMVNESLVAYLKRTVGKEHEQDYRNLLQYTEDSYNLSDEDKKAIVKALYNCKILDPACGSGAFPMGILQQMVHLLKELDPDNKEWKSILTKQTKADASNAIDEETKEERDDALEDVKRNFDTDINDPDYARKLYLIENCIYGIDIQPIAIQISKLRFFISLVVDQKPNDKPEENFGIRPLPNLEAKFVAADTLTGLKKQEATLFSGDITHIQEELKTANHKIFRAKTVRTKTKYRTKVADLRKELVEQLKSNNVVASEDAEQLASWDMFDQNQSASFFDSEWMFGITDGFDIVLGNPPYRQLQDNGGELGRKYQASNYQTFASTGDIYCLFYEKTLKLLKPSGHSCLITSNKWMRAGYGEKTRTFLSKSANPLLLVDFAGVKVFQSATVDTNILLCEKTNCHNETVCAETKGIGKDGFNNLSDYVLQHSSTMDFKSVGGNSWVILSPIEQSIKKKIESVGVPLKDWDIQINYGIKTGYNDAFIITSEKRDEILSNCKNSTERKRTAELIRPILRGRDIKRYSYDWADLWLINTHNGVKGKFPRIDIDQYPAIKAHLDKYWSKIKNRADQGDTPYNLRNCAYLEDFAKPKVMWKIIGCNINFAFDDQGMFCNNAVDIMTGNKNRLIQFVGLMNSKLFDWYLKLTTEAEVQGGGIQLYVTTLEKTLLKLDFDKNFTNKILDRIHGKINDSELDNIICQVYGLTKNETKYILN